MSSSVPVEVANLFSIKGIVAVVTGGGTGIGLMIATALEANGGTVYILGRRSDVLEKAAAENNKYGKIIPLQCDVTSRESILSVVEIVKSRHGYINLLVNNAGVSKNPILSGGLGADVGNLSITELQSKMWNAGTPEDFAQTFAINVQAAYYVTVAFLELLDAGNKKGNLPGVTSQVITVTSIGAFRRNGLPSTSYSISKAAATHLGKIFTNLFANYKIRSNVIAPGIYPSEMTEKIIGNEEIKQTIPAKRFGTLDDMGGLVIFLSSRAGAYVNGAVHISDGGRLSGVPATY